MAGDETLHTIESLGEVPFRLADPQKRSRFNQRDCEKLMLIVARRKTYSAPHGTGETEWQGVADEVAGLLRDHVKASAVSRRASGVAETHTTLSDYNEAYLQLKTSFEEKRNAEKDKKTRGAKCLALLVAAQCVRTGPGQREALSATGSSDDSDHGEQDEGANSDAELRFFLGSAYSSEDEETQEEGSSSEGDESEDQQEETSSRNRSRLRVSDIWAREKEMMEKERELQASRDRNIESVLEALLNQSKMLFDELKTSRVNDINNQH
ncbi:hypothetical protein F443_12444 [Phytophthora nicotianae P1569]|uniref:Uncharacterized protein n=1 Tax=Phytophthora nicotianae P1569 TaxID=1317065 RepID=V9EVC6_PHYNI|nr:hypothetical protein F443_12444 [Phytophthora nicotianae P1569]